MAECLDVMQVCPTLLVFVLSLDGSSLASSSSLNLLMFYILDFYWSRYQCRK